MSPTVLFTHLKIILLQYFQFSIVSKRTQNRYIIDPTKMFQTFHFFFGSTTTTLTENKKSKVKTLIVAPYKKEQSLFTTPPRKYLYKIGNILFYTNKNRPSIINVLTIIIFSLHILNLYYIILLVNLFSLVQNKISLSFK